MTLARAAGDAHRTVPLTDDTAWLSALAVRVRGFVTSIAGITDVMPRAGPSTAQGAKAATRESASVSP
ncbi:unannotated protein [freshwater metagenome]|uniref:Unannotated protein n=1 Tax=freshwater metagenome TaxID=449393 RepID=A0A6J7HI44_9ZZZZ